MTDDLEEIMNAPDETEEQAPDASEAADASAGPENASEQPVGQAPPFMVDDHGDLAMGWKVLFLVLCLVLGPLSPLIWWALSARGRRWNEEHGHAWRAQRAESADVPGQGPMQDETDGLPV